MDNIRVFLWLTLLGLAWLTYTAWQADYGAPPTSSVVRPPPQAADNAAPDDTLPSLGETPAPPSSPPNAETPPPQPTGELIRVRTDVLDLRIASQGGDPVRADLLEYTLHKDQPEPLVRLLDDTGPERWVFQSGVRSAGCCSSWRC